MPKIEISDESYEFVKNLINEIETQDNRSTAYPILYMIQVKERIFGMSEDYSTEYKWIDFGNDHEEFTDEELKLELIKYYDFSKSEVDKLDNCELEEKIEELHLDYTKVYYEDVERYKHNIFFTEKAAKQHIKLNHYHYNSPQDYVIHAWRNPEVENIVKVLKEIAGE